jgi:hypothetical protein
MVKIGAKNATLSNQRSPFLGPATYGFGVY